MTDRRRTNRSSVTVWVTDISAAKRALAALKSGGYLPQLCDVPDGCAAYTMRGPWADEPLATRHYIRVHIHHPEEDFSAADYGAIRVLVCRTGGTHPIPVFGA